jgi:hypothetical protein
MGEGGRPPPVGWPPPPNVKMLRRLSIVICYCLHLCSPVSLGSPLACVVACTRIPLWPVPPLVWSLVAPRVRVLPVVPAFIEPDWHPPIGCHLPLWSSPVCLLVPYGAVRPPVSLGKACMDPCDPPPLVWMDTWSPVSGRCQALCSPHGGRCLFPCEAPPFCRHPVI